MISVRDCVSQVTKAQLDSQWSTTTMLADKTVDSIEQLSDLNLNLARATFEQSNLVARQLAAAENARQFFLLAAAQAKPNTERVFDYGYYLTNIASTAQEEFIKLVGMRMADANSRLIELLADLADAVPAGLKIATDLVRPLGGCNGIAGEAAQTTVNKSDIDRKVRGGRQRHG